MHGSGCGGGHLPSSWHGSKKGPFFVCPPPQDVLGLDEWQGDIRGNTHNFVGAGKAAKSKRNSPDVLAALRWNINAVLTEAFIFHFHRGILFFKAVALKRKAPPPPRWFLAPSEQAAEEGFDVSHAAVAPEIHPDRGEVTPRIRPGAVSR